MKNWRISPATDCFPPICQIYLWHLCNRSNVPWCDSLQRERNSNPGLQNTIQTHQHIPVCARELLSPSRGQKRNCHRRMSPLPEKHKQQGRVWDNRLEHLQNRGYPPEKTKKRLMDITYDSRSEHLNHKGRREQKKPSLWKHIATTCLSLASHTYLRDSRARSGRGEGEKIRMVNVARFPWALAECWQSQSDCRERMMSCKLNLECILV